MMKKIVHMVFQHPAMLDKPPVLVDVGASGALHQQWRHIAPYAVCIAFDADTRDFSISSSTVTDYKKIYKLNRLLAAKKSDAVNFYLTSSPHCSSSLKPDSKALRPWAFRDLFEVNQVVQMPAVDLNEALAGCGIDYVDWYKTDSQGTDLRIFDALPREVIKRMVAAEFEPGILDAYEGEDKLHSLMAYMDNCPFWVTRMILKGSQRIDKRDYDSLNFIQRKRIGSFLKMAPGWCEVSYLNDFDGDGMGLREYLMGWVFSSIMEEHGFALRLARIGGTKYSDPLFDELASYSRKSLSHAGGYFSLLAIVGHKVMQLLAGGRYK